MKIQLRVYGPLFKLRLDDDILDSLIKYAKDKAPLEAVAFLLGRAKGHEYLTEQIRYVRNADNSPESFSVAPDELYDVYTQVDGVGLSVVGLFHSHPAPARPSSTDIGYMKLNGFVWVIASSVTWEVRAYILTRSCLHPVKIIG